MRYKKSCQGTKARLDQSDCQALRREGRQGKQEGKRIEISKRLATMERGQGKGITPPAGTSGQKHEQTPSHPSPADLQVEAQIEKLRSEAGQMAALERGELLKVLHQQGLSLHELGRRLGRNPKLVRDLVQLANLPEDKKQQIREGKLGRKKALKMATAMKSAAGQPPPSLTTAEVEEQAKPFVSLIVDWLLRAELTYDDRENFFTQVCQGLALNGVLKELFKQEAPTPQAIRSINDPWGVIKRTEPHDPELRYSWEVINHLVLWFARWAQRVMPNKRVLIEAAYAAQQRILHIRHTSWFLRAEAVAFGDPKQKGTESS